jgi:hypothetical protein
LRSSAFDISSQKHDIFAKPVLTWKRLWAYNPLTDEGGGAAGDEVLVSKIFRELAEC